MRKYVGDQTLKCINVALKCLPHNSAMNAICLIELVCLSVTSITTATPLETVIETPTKTDGDTDVETIDAVSLLAPALFDDWLR